MEILAPILIVSLIGLLAGVILAVASIVMAVPKDEKAEALEEVLPGANCGACGYSGCPGYAAAMAKGEASPGLCSPGGEAVAKQCAEILGSGDVAVVRKVALVHCLGSCDNTGDKMEYDGIPSCAAALPLAGGAASCRFGCLGLGDCVQACEYDAIRVCNGLAQVDPAQCKGCSKCVAACPKGLISLVEAKPQAVVRCSSCDKAKGTMAVCQVGCIGCGKCMRTCQFGAVTVENGLAKIDPAKCTACGQCVAACPPACDHPGAIGQSEKRGKFLAFSPAGSGAARRWRPFSAGLRCRFGRSWTRPTGAQDPNREVRPAVGQRPTGA